MRLYPGLFPWRMERFTPDEWALVQRDMRALEAAARDR